MNAVLSALVEDQIGPGEQTKLLIQNVREKLKFDYCLALRSPVIALYLAFKSLGLEKGQGVIISALSPLYYAQVLQDLGLIPLYCDVHPSAAVMSRETLDRALASKPAGLDIRCIALHHTLGYLADYTAIKELGIPLIEDCSQSFGTGFLDPKPGEELQSTGVLSILGLEEKDMLTAGGGALLYSKRSAGHNSIQQNLPPEYGLPDMNAAMAVAQFKEFEKNLVKRREISELYTRSVLRTRHKRFIQQGADYNNYAFPLILETGVKEVKAYARRKDIAVESAFTNTPIANAMLNSEQCPEAYSLSLRTVLFPLYPRLGMAGAEKVAKLIQTLP